MKYGFFPRTAFILPALFLFACAQPRPSTVPRSHIPPDNIPRIETPDIPAIPDTASDASSQTGSPEAPFQPATPNSSTTVASYFPSSPAVEKKRPQVLKSMIDRASTQIRQGKPAQAFQTLERALSIDGQDPLVWHLMAQAQQDQAQYGQAKSLAEKSNTLAGSDSSLKKKNWQIIAMALDKQGKFQEAEQAKLKAR